MDEKDFREAIHRLHELADIVQQQQILLFTLWIYLKKQPSFDAKQFAALHAEFSTDAIAALTRHAGSEPDTFLKLLEAFQGRPH